MRYKWILFFTFTCFFICTLNTLNSQTTKPVSVSKSKVLVVMSYDLDLPWAAQIKEGIDSILGKSCELKYITMNTKKNLQGGPDKAQEAFQLYQEWKPDGVIAVDDNAQSMFVVPYLKEKTNIPIIFCGVNFSAEKYEYPRSHISGVTERYLLKETFEYACAIQPKAKTVSFLSKKSPTADSIIRQIENEKESFPLEVLGFHKVTTLEEALHLAHQLRQESDVLFIGSVQGLKDSSGNPIPEEESIPQIVDAFGKITVSSSSARVKIGVLCSVAQVGQEQGVLAAEKLLKALNGTPVKDIPIESNRFGQRILNVDTLKKLGIKIRPSIIRNTQLVGKKHKFNKLWRSKDPPKI